MWFWVVTVDTNERCARREGAHNLEYRRMTLGGGEAANVELPVTDKSKFD